MDAKLPSLSSLDSYVEVGRVLAENMGSINPYDYTDKHIRTLILEMMKFGNKLFTLKLEPEEWKNFEIKGGHIISAL